MNQKYLGLNFLIERVQKKTRCVQDIYASVCIHEVDL